MDCPVTREDVMAAEDIFGTNLGSLKGKTPRSASTPVDETVTAVPPAIMERCKEIVLAVDLMFINKVPLLVTISHNLKFGTVAHLKNKSKGQILEGIRQTKNLYNSRGFTIVECRGDYEFEATRDGLAEMQIMLNATSRDEHVPEIERYNRTIKDRVRSAYNMLPFKKMPTQMLVELVKAMVFWLNAFPANDGVSDTISPRTIMTGKRLNYTKHCQLGFGTYVQTHEEHDNGMGSRTTGAIALRPTGNSQGGYFFMSLTTGKRLARGHWTVLPMPNEVIANVEARAGGQGGPDTFDLSWGGEAPEETIDARMVGEDDFLPAPTGVNAPQQVQQAQQQQAQQPAGAMNPFAPLFAGDDDDDDAVIQDDQNDDGGIAGAYDAQQQPQVEHMDEIIALANNVEQVLDELAELGERTIDSETTGVSDSFNDQSETTGVWDQSQITGVNESSDDDGSVGLDGMVPIVPVEQMAGRYGGHPRREGLRPQKQRDFGPMYDFQDTVLTQYGVKQGLKKFGKPGEDAVTVELKQLHDRDVIVPVHADDLTRQEKQRALAYLMFLKQKRCGRIKGRGCADGRKQRIYKSKQEISSPTVSIESVFLTCTIDAKEGRDVATCDVPGAFMQTDIDELIHVRMDGELAELLAKIDPGLYEKYMVPEGNKRAIYLRLTKALYGTLQAALLFWKDLSGALAEWGFELNEYDRCVANKTIDGKQCTILWHVDDLKISHVDEAVVTKILEILNERYGKITPLVVTRGKIHDYLGMTLDFSTDECCVVRMDDYVESVLAEAPTDMDGEAETPAAEHLFTVRNDAPKVSKEVGDLFHSLTARLLFLSKRARPEIQTAVAFLCTRT
jgi:Reverse transcriptase (RNA-dependent DNA polymerase)